MVEREEVGMWCRERARDMDGAGVALGRRVVLRLGVNVVCDVSVDDILC